MTAVEVARLVLQGRWEKVQESDNTQLPSSACLLSRWITIARFVYAIFKTTCPGWNREPLPGEPRLGLATQPHSTPYRQ